MTADPVAAAILADCSNILLAATRLAGRHRNVSWRAREVVTLANQASDALRARDTAAARQALDRAQALLDDARAAAEALSFPPPANATGAAE